MVEIRVKDLKVDGKGIFHYINNAEPLPFPEPIEIEVLEMGFYMRHGEKLVTPYVLDIYNSDDKEHGFIMLGKVINAMYRSKWEKTLTHYFNDLDVETYKLITTETSDIKDTRTSTREDISDSERKGFKSGFDSDDMVDDDKEITTGNLNVTDTGESDQVKEVTREVKGNISNKLDDSLKYNNILVRS